MSLKETLKQLIIETIQEEYLELDESLLLEKWSDKYKRSIDCNNQKVSVNALIVKEEKKMKV